MKKVLRAVLILIVIAGVAGGGYWVYRTQLAGRAEEAERKTYSDTAVVTRGTLEAVVETRGALTAVQMRALTFVRLDGYNEVKQVNFVEGMNTTEESYADGVADPLQSWVDGTAANTIPMRYLKHCQQVAHDASRRRSGSPGHLC